MVGKDFGYFSLLFSRVYSCCSLIMHTKSHGAIASSLAFRCPGITGALDAFDDCTNLTSLGQTYKSSMYECTDNAATLSYYESDSCSGDVLVSSEVSNNTCINGQIDRCTSEGEGRTCRNVPGRQIPGRHIDRQYR